MAPKAGVDALTKAAQLEERAAKSILQLVNKAAKNFDKLALLDPVPSARLTLLTARTAIAEWARLRVQGAHVTVHAFTAQAAQADSESVKFQKHHQSAVLKLQKKETAAVTKLLEGVAKLSVSQSPANSPETKRRAPPPPSGPPPASAKARAKKKEKNFFTTFSYDWQVPGDQLAAGLDIIQEFATLVQQMAQTDGQMSEHAHQLSQQTVAAQKDAASVEIGKAIANFAANTEARADGFINRIYNPMMAFLKETGNELTNWMTHHTNAVKACNDAVSECKELRDQAQSAIDKARRLAKPSKVATKSAQTYINKIISANKMHDVVYGREREELLTRMGVMHGNRLEMLCAVMRNLALAFECPKTDVFNARAVVARTYASAVERIKPTDDLAKYLVESRKVLGPQKYNERYEYELLLTLYEIKTGIMNENPNSYFRSTLKRCMVLDAARDIAEAKSNKKSRGGPVKRSVPKVLTVLIDAVQTVGKGLKTEGLFRISAAKSDLDKVAAQLDAGHWDVPDIPGQGAHIPAGLLKWFLRSMREPVIPHSKYAEAMDLARDPLLHSEHEGLVSVWQSLDPLRQNVVKAVVQLCGEVLKKENTKINKMSLYNLGVVFGPSLLKDVSEVDDGVFVMMEDSKDAANFAKHFFRMVADRLGVVLPEQ